MIYAPSSVGGAASEAKIPRPPTPAHNKAMILGTDSDGVGKNVADYLFSKSPLT